MLKLTIGKSKRFLVTGGGIAACILALMAVLLLSACAASAPVKEDGNTAASVGSSGGPDSAGEGGDPLTLSGGGGLIDPFELEEWDIVNFTDPRDSSTYEIIDGRVIIAFCDPPDLPVVDPNYFDVERDPATDPYYSAITYHHSMTQTLAGLTMQYDPAVAAFIAAENVTVYSEWPMVAGLAVTLPEGQTVVDAVANWPTEYAGLIEAVDPDRIIDSCTFPSTQPNDHLFSAQWHLHNDSDWSYLGIPPQPYAASVVPAWQDSNMGSDLRVVAVIDTGVDFQSRDLQNSSAEYGINTGDKTTSTEFLPRSSGGGEPWSFLMNRSQAYAAGLGHGTLVAGAIAAVVNNDGCGAVSDLACAGVVPNACYLAVAMKGKGIGSEGNYSSTWSRSALFNALTAIGAVKGIPAYQAELVYGVGVSPSYLNIEVCNMSFGEWGTGCKLGNRHLDYLGDFILFVAAAGNDDNRCAAMWPASHDKVMSVAAHDASGYRSVWSAHSASNYQNYVDISAPGSYILTTDMVGYTSNGYYRGRDTGEIYPADGTSLSSPIVAGVAVLVNSKWPSLWPQMVRSHIVGTAIHDLPDATVNQFGRVDADSAL